MLQQQPSCFKVSASHYGGSKQNELAVANAAVAAEGEADSLSDSSDIKYLGDNCVGVNLHHDASYSQHSDITAQQAQRTSESSIVEG